MKTRNTASGPASKKVDRQEEALATVQTADVAVRSAASETFAAMTGYDASDVRGKEGIESSDLRLPFLCLAQKTSKALDSTEDSYIPGLTFGDMYNSETKETYGRAGLIIIPLRSRKRAYLPDENGRMGEVIDWNDPRCNWPTKADIEARTAAGWDAKTIDKPEGVRVIDWVVLLMLETGAQLGVISFKSKSFAAGQSLMTFVSMVKGPAFTGKYKITSILDTNDAGKFAKFGVQPAGKPTAEEAEFAAGIYDSVKDKTLVVAEEPVDAEPSANTTKKDDKVPF